jgi:hypothetical protein
VHRQSITKWLWVVKTKRQFSFEIAQPTVELLHCGDSGLTDRGNIKVSKQNQMLIWLWRNLDLHGRGQYGPRGF